LLALRLLGLDLLVLDLGVLDFAAVGLLALDSLALAFVAPDLLALDFVALDLLALDFAALDWSVAPVARLERVAAAVRERPEPPALFRPVERFGGEPLPPADLRPREPLESDPFFEDRWPGVRRPVSRWLSTAISPPCAAFRIPARLHLSRPGLGKHYRRYPFVNLSTRRFRRARQRPTHAR
jgi:hypothetical protein